MISGTPSAAECESLAQSLVIFGRASGQIAYAVELFDGDVGVNPQCVLLADRCGGGVAAGDLQVFDGGPLERDRKIGKGGGGQQAIADQTGEVEQDEEMCLVGEPLTRIGQ